MLTSDVRGADVGSETETKTTMFENHRDDERRGQVGIGTLIVFIAMVLVAAIAAGVLVNTAGFLQSTAEDTGEESVDKVTNRVEVVNSYGDLDTNGNNISTVYLTVRMAAGSAPIEMEEATIGYLSETNSTTLLGLNDTDGTPGNAANATHFEISAVKDSDNSRTVLNDKGDRFQLAIDAESLEGGAPGGLAPGDTLTLEITTASGDTTVYRVTTPDSYSGKDGGDPIGL